MTALGRLNDPAPAPFPYRTGILYSVNSSLNFDAALATALEFRWYGTIPGIILLRLRIRLQEKFYGSRKNFEATGRQLCGSDSLSLGNNIYTSIEKSAGVHINEAPAP
jgi:hypothetical protein